MEPGDASQAVQTEQKMTQIRMKTALLFATMLLGVGCGSKASTTRTLTLNLARTGVNDGRTFYVIARATDQASFMSDSYEKIADLVKGKSSDILGMQLIWPKQNQVLKFKVPTDQAVAVYCLFTTPNSDWKILLNPPLKNRYVLNLEGGNVELQLSKK